MRRTLAVGALTATIIGITGGSALATPEPETQSGGALPEGSGPWAPVEEVIPGYYDPVEVAACDTTVTITAGDVGDVEARVTELPDGYVLEARGAQTIDLTREDTGQMIDELDVSGSYYEVVRPSADEATLDIIGVSSARTILYPYPELGPVDAAAFEAAGIPDLAYLKNGYIRFDLVVDASTGQAITEEADVQGRVVDLCTWFDGNRGHGNNNGNNGHHYGDRR